MQQKEQKYTFIKTSAMDSSFTRSSNSSERSGTVSRAASPIDALGAEGQGMQTFRDDAPLLTLIQTHQTGVMSPMFGTPSSAWDIDLLPQGKISQVVREGMDPVLQSIIRSMSPHRPSCTTIASI